jgi:polyphosphate kinase 2 (PPK2 family)
VTRQEQLRRFAARETDPLKQWKLTSIDRDLRLEPRLRSEGETKMARTNQRSPITRSANAIRPPPQWNEVFGF